MPHLSTDRLLRAMGIGLVSTALSACSFIRPFVDARQALAPVRANQTADPDEAPEITIETARWVEDVFRIRPTLSSGRLPDKRIDKLSVTEAGLYDVIQLLFENTRMAVTFEGGTDNIRRYGPVTTYNLSGNLNEVMEHLGQAIGFFWSVRDNSLIIEAEQQFIVELPPVLNDDNLAGITNTLQYLGVRDSYLDRNERRLVFRCNRKVLRSVETYMQKLRETRSMIIYDAQILQVDLRDTEKMGIQWARYAKTGTSSGSNSGSASNGTTGGTSGGTGTTDATTTTAGSSVVASSGSAGFDITLVGRSFSGSALIEFLRTQGTVKNLSKPRIGVMSGTRGALRVGNNTTIVSKVGRDISNTVSQTTVETKDVKTGLELNLFGEEHDRTVYTRISLSITELLELTTFEALGTRLSLPKIADRELRTQIRSRPGDTIILGGITINRAENEAAKGIAIFSRRTENTVSELVVVLRPRLVVFRPFDHPTQTDHATPHNAPYGTPLVPPHLKTTATETPSTPLTSPSTGTPQQTPSALMLAPRLAESAQSPASPVTTITTLPWPTTPAPASPTDATAPGEDAQRPSEDAVALPVEMPPDADSLTRPGDNQTVEQPVRQVIRQAIGAAVEADMGIRVPDIRVTTPQRQFSANGRL